jgi:hypothetical protein
MKLLGVALSKDGQIVISINEDLSLCAWSLRHGKVAEPSRYLIRFPTKHIKQSRIFLEFLNSNICGVIVGSQLLIIDATQLASFPGNVFDPESDPSFLLHRVGLPCIATCVSRVEGDFLIGSESGVLYRINDNGRLVYTYSVASESLTACRSVRDTHLIVGTDKGNIMFFNLSANQVKASWRSSQPAPITYLSIDAKSNWFCAISKSRLISGSTKTLVQVFESPVFSTDLKRCEFVQLASKGLCIATLSSSPRISVLPLDLSSEGRTYQESDSGYSSMATSTDLVALAGSSVQILSSSSLSLIRQLVVYMIDA